MVHPLRFWHGLRPHIRHWIKNIAIGVAIEFVLVPALHLLFPQLLLTLENMALDRMMAIHAVIDPAPVSGRVPPRQILVNVDDATWRSAQWGGGEPDRAPRAALLKLIDIAFRHGARQVVLDVLVEGRSTAEDEQFADGLRSLFAGINPGDRQLVLVRSLRHPLPQLALGAGAIPVMVPYPALSELRTAPPLDRVIGDSAGRIVVAAPYFVYSADHVLRDWQMLSVVCEHRTAGGIARVIPSVQLMVVTRHLGVAAGTMAAASDERCSTLPQQEPDRMPAASALAVEQEAVDQLEQRAASAYWKALGAALHEAPGRSGDLAPAALHPQELANRVIFRTAAFHDGDQYFAEVPARLLLNDELDEPRLKEMFSGRVATIGQTFAEAGDQHTTPLGQLSGAVILMNAIDSMARYRLIQEPDHWLHRSVTLALIVLVGYVFARWNSALGPLISIVLAVPALAILSFYLFKYGVWLDFSLPLIGILLHREYKSFEERIELRVLAQQGADKRH